MSLCILRGVSDADWKGNVQLRWLLALGASQTQVLADLVRTGFFITVFGLLAGSVVSLFVGRFLAPLLYGVEPTDLLTWSAVTVTLLVIGVAASYLPARRAAAVQPTEALRMQ